MELEGKVAVVTGGGSGLGRFIVEALRAAGARVIVADVTPGEGVTPADVTTETGRAAVLAAAQAAGGLDVLVNNAGGWTVGGEQFPDATAAAWRSAIELNLLAPMALAQDALPALGRGHGAVVNIASSAAVDTSAYASPEYAGAKAALIRFTTAVADWRERYAVRVNCIVPGWIGLERAHRELAAMSPAERASAPALVPPTSVAAQVLRLARDESLAGCVVGMLDGDQEPCILHRSDE
jgi:NAD(P)-dependent dehydrogenase (short-subunit alcohol dehydrogenase family)